MTDSDVDASVDGGAAPVPASAGALLRAARESSGMTIDAVAQQLKLAPRQVRAIEDGDFTHLPGRTFVRGFIRNYARLLRLDAEVVLGALPAGTSSPNLESPALHATAPTIGELPTTEAPRHGWTRWAIPLTLIAIICSAAAWELLHPAPDSTRVGAKKEAPPVAERAKAGAPEVIGTPLPNPVAASSPSLAGSSPAPEKALVADPAPAVVAAKAATDSTPDAALPRAPAVAEAPLVLVFRDFSWTEVKDRSGRVLLSRMNAGGTTQSIAGAPPLDLVVGNASDVTLTWKGTRVDLAPHTRQNVARFTLE